MIEIYAYIYAALGWDYFAGPQNVMYLVINRNFEIWRAIFSQVDNAYTATHTNKRNKSDGHNTRKMHSLVHVVVLKRL